jgi:hypothetical protein
MQVKKVLQILDVVDNLPSDIRHMLYEEDTSMDMDGAYYSDSRRKYIPVVEMDIVHLLRSFKRMNEDAYINKQIPTKVGEEE